MSMSKGSIRRASSCALFFFVLCAYPGFGQPARPRAQQPARKRQVKHAAPQFVSNRYIVFLQDPPVSARYTQRETMATVEAIGYQRQIVSRQQSLMTELASRNIRVTGSVNTLLNAVFVAAGPDRLAEIRALPGVIGVMPERVMKLSLNKATALANAPAAWNQASIGGQSNAGRGIKIAILDTGIDNNHPAFQDSTRSEEHTSELQSLRHLVCRLLLEKKSICLRGPKSTAALFLDRCLLSTIDRR